MKKFLTIVALVLLCKTGFSQETTKIDSYKTMSLQKGSLIVKDFIDIGNFNTVKGEIAILTNVTSGVKVYALRVSKEYQNSKYDNGVAIGVYDEKEIDSAITALKYMMKKVNEENSSSYSEVIYKNNSESEFGYFVRDGNFRGFFTVNEKGTQYFEIREFNDLLKFFTLGKEKIREIGGNFN